MWMSVSRDEKWAVGCWRHVCGMCVYGQAAVCPHSEEVSDLQLNTGDGWERGGHLVYMGAITVTLGRLRLIRNSTEWGWALFGPWQQLCKVWWILLIQCQSLLFWKLKWDVLINRVHRCVKQPFLNLMLPSLFSWGNLTTLWNFTVLADRVNSYENYQPSINALLVILRRNVPVWW